MNDAIIYRPYKNQVWAIFFTIIIGVIAFAGAGYCLPFFGLGVLCLILTVIGIVCIWLTQILYDSSKIAVLFEQNGVRIIGGSHLEYRYIPWEELTYACYARSYRGHLFLILSPKVLNRKEAKRFADKGANSSRICVDSVAVIYIDILQDVSRLKELIGNHISQIDTY